MGLRLQTLTVNTNLVTEECCNCGVLFAMPKDVQERRLRDHKDFYCPNGHSQHYTGKTEEQKLREKLKVEQRRSSSLLASRDQATARADHEAARAAGYKGALTKTKKRIGNGVCPCCNRHFANVERHMRRQHPESAEETVDAG